LALFKVLAHHHFVPEKVNGKNCDILEDSAAKEGGFTVTEMCISMAAGRDDN
jgi:hypothetical protein